MRFCGMLPRVTSLSTQAVVSVTGRKAKNVIHAASTRHTRSMFSASCPAAVAHSFSSSSASSPSSYSSSSAASASATPSSTLNKPPTAVVMLNMGGPATVSDVGPFLQRLFSDGMIIQLGKMQKLGEYIAKLRTPKIEKQYAAIGGSPIRKWSELQGREFCKLLDLMRPASAPHKAYVAFAYADPLAEEALAQMRKDGVTRAIAFSQYPMYSCTTTGASLSKLWDEVRKAGLEESITWSVIDRWNDHPAFIAAVAQRIRMGMMQFREEERKDVVVLFSAHSLPHKVVNKGDQYSIEVSHTVQLVMKELEKSLGVAQVTTSVMSATSAVAATSASFSSSSSPSSSSASSDNPGSPFPSVYTPAMANSYVLSWQSKVGLLPWLGPSTSDAIKGLKKNGINNVLAVPIAFTSDHVETLYEIDIEYEKEAQDVGMTGFKRAPSLNDEPLLIQAQADLVATHLDSNEASKSTQFRINCLACVNPNCRSIINPVVPFQSLKTQFKQAAGGK